MSAHRACHLFGALALCSAAQGAHAQQLIWSVLDSGDRSFLGVTPDGHSVLVKPGLNSIAVQRYDTNGVPEAPFTLDLTLESVSEDIFGSAVLDATGAFQVSAETSPPSARLYYRFSPLGARDWVLSSADDAKLCGAGLPTEAGGRVFLCEEIVDANPMDPDFEYRYRVSRYSPQGTLEYSAATPVDLVVGENDSAIAAVQLAPGANGRAGYCGTRYRTVNGMPQPPEWFGVVLEANGGLRWSETHTGVTALPKTAPQLCQLGVSGELAISGSGAGTFPSHQVGRFGSNGASDFALFFEGAFSGSTFGLTRKLELDAAGHVYSAGRCIREETYFVPCFGEFAPNGTTLRANLDPPVGSAAQNSPGVEDFALGLLGDAWTTQGGTAKDKWYLRRLGASGAVAWELAFTRTGQFAAASKLGTDQTGDLYSGASWSDTEFGAITRTELRKFQGGEIFANGFEG
jgi:hypothetical protein